MSFQCVYYDTAYGYGCLQSGANQNRKRMRIDEIDVSEQNKDCQKEYISSTSKNSLLSPINSANSQQILPPMSSECMSFIFESLFDAEDKSKSVQVRPQLKEQEQKPKQQSEEEDDEDESQQMQLAYMSPAQNNMLASNVLTKSPKQQKVSKTHKKSSVHIKWNIVEDAKLLDLHKEYGNQWALIAAHLHGKSRIQVKTRYRSICRAAKRFWSSEQDRLLVTLYSQFGFNWNDDIAIQFPTKTKVSIKKRLHELLNQNGNVDYHPPNSPYHILSSRPGIVNTLLNADNSLSENE